MLAAATKHITGCVSTVTSYMIAMQVLCCNGCIAAIAVTDALLLFGCGDCFAAVAARRSYYRMSSKLICFRM